LMVLVFLAFAALSGRNDDNLPPFKSDCQHLLYVADCASCETAVAGDVALCVTV
jgi:hypothetical protein